MPGHTNSCPSGRRKNLWGDIVEPPTSNLWCFVSHTKCGCPAIHSVLERLCPSTGPNQEWGSVVSESPPPQPSTVCSTQKQLPTRKILRGHKKEEFPFFVDQRWKTTEIFLLREGTSNVNTLGETFSSEIPFLRSPFFH